MKRIARFMMPMSSASPPRRAACVGGLQFERWMQMLLILLVIVLLLSIGSVPAWPYSRGWGYYPSGGLGVIVIILLILILMRF